MRALLLRSIVWLPCLASGSGCGARSDLPLDAGQEPDADADWDPVLDSGLPDAPAVDGGFVTTCTNQAEGSWEVELVAPDGIFPSIAVDGGGVPHVAFVTDGNQVLATRVEGAWTVQTVERVLYTDLGPAVAVDLSGSVHIAFNTYLTDSGALRELRYARLLESVWSVETVPSNECLAAGLTVDRKGAAHVTCGRENVDYATNAGGVWLVETAVGGGGTSGELAIDPEGVVHLVSGDRLFARREGWVQQAVLPGRGSGLAFDSAGVAHVALSSAASGFGHAFQAADGFDLEVLDPRGGEGGSTPIAVDEDDFVHIAFAVDEGVGDCEVWYATNATGGWVGQQIDGGVLCRDDSHRWLTWPSVAVDPNEVHLVYASKAGICHAHQGR